MAINKNDCLDCANSINKSITKHNWVCTKGHVIPTDKDGIIEVLDHDCEDFSYQE